MGRRIEASPRGRLAISVLIAVILAVILISNLPPSRTRAVLIKPVAPLLRSTGLAQSWYLFAPDPSLATVRLAAVIEYEDGTRLSWTPPSHGRFLGAYNDYHWRGLDAAAQANVKGRLWPGLARWLAESNQKPDGPVVTGVTFYRGIADTPAPGSHRKRRWRLEKLSTFNAPFDQ